MPRSPCRRSLWRHFLWRFYKIHFCFPVASWSARARCARASTCACARSLASCAARRCSVAKRAANAAICPVPPPWPWPWPCAGVALALVGLVHHASEATPAGVCRWNVCCGCTVRAARIESGSSEAVTSTRSAHDAAARGPQWGCVVRRASCAVRRASCVVRRAPCVVRRAGRWADGITHTPPALLVLCHPPLRAPACTRNTHTHAHSTHTLTCSAATRTRMRAFSPSANLLSPLRPHWL